MITFYIGLAILIIGGFFYGKFVERVFKPDDRQTPAVRMNDGVDFVPMKKSKNALINLLNIAGTGPVFGPIQGILFGPIAFLTIPIGCVISGATHDYLSGMISLRQDGAQMPAIIKKFIFLISLIPGTFYLFIISSFLLYQPIGFHLPIGISYIIAGVLATAYFVGVILVGKRFASKNEEE